MQGITGVLTLSRPLTDDEYYYLGALAINKRMRRKRPLVQMMIDQGELDDPHRNEVNLPLGMDGCFFVGNKGEHFDEFDASVFNKEAPPRGCPGSWVSWVPNPNNRSQMILSGKKEQHAGRWAKFLVTKLLSKHWGISANGVVTYSQVNKGLINTQLTIIKGSTVIITGERKRVTPADQFR